MVDDALRKKSLIGWKKAQRSFCLRLAPTTRCPFDLISPLCVPLFRYRHSACRWWISCRRYPTCYLIKDRCYLSSVFKYRNVQLTNTKSFFCNWFFSLNFLYLVIYYNSLRMFPLSVDFLYFYVTKWEIQVNLKFFVNSNPHA